MRAPTIFRGLLRAWNGGSDEAIADFERAMIQSPRDPFNYNAMLGIALAYHNAGRHAEAADCADRAVRAFPPFFLIRMGQSSAMSVQIAWMTPAG